MAHCKMLELTGVQMPIVTTTATIKLKLMKSIPKSHPQKKLDIAKLQYLKKNKEFVLELRNRFSTPKASPEMEEERTIKLPSNP